MISPPLADAWSREVRFTVSPMMVKYQFRFEAVGEVELKNSGRSLRCHRLMFE